MRTRRSLPATAAWHAMVVASIIFLIVLTAGSAARAAQAPVGLGTAGNFAVLAGSTITNTGPTTITGDVGLHPGNSVTGFNSVTLNGQLHVADAVAQQAKADLVTAFNDVAGRGPATTVATDLGGQLLNAGVYNSASGTFEITGTLTLDAAGDSNAVFIFQAATTLVTATNSSVTLINGADACNVFWKIGSSATLGTGTSFKGNILALTSITLNTRATAIRGRMLAQNGAVTLDTNTIERSACSAAPAPTPGPTSPPTPPPTPTQTSTPASTPSSSPTATITTTPPASSPGPTATPTASSSPTVTSTAGPTATASAIPNPGAPSAGGTTSGSSDTPATPVTDLPSTGGAPMRDAFPWLLLPLIALAGLKLAVSHAPRLTWHPWSREGLPSRGLLAIALIATMGVGFGNASAHQAKAELSPTPSKNVAWASGVGTATAAGSASALEPIFPGGLDLHAPPVVVPLELRIPSLKLTGSVVGVGIAPNGGMDAPMGTSRDPVWQEAFWYRGGAIPGDPGTATIAGHVSGGRGPSLFAHLHNLMRGDLIVVRDARSGLDIHFLVTATKIYSREQFGDTSVLARVYGAGPVAGRVPRSVAGGGSHLTLITCAGTYAGSSYDHRLVVYAERTNRSS